MGAIARLEPPTIAELNTTPLIDVMLVLLIMFIVTIPIQSHAVKLDLPGKPAPILIDAISNEVVVTANGELLWNGTRLTKQQLVTQLAAVGQMAAQPEVHLMPDAEARYAPVDEVLAMTKRARIKRLGFVANERYARF